MQMQKSPFSFLEELDFDSKYIEELSSKCSEDESISHLLNTLNNYFSSKPINSLKAKDDTFDNVSNQSEVQKSSETPQLENHGSTLEFKNNQLLLLIQRQLKENDLLKNLIKEKDGQISKISKLASSYEAENLDLKLEILSVKSKLKMKDSSYQLKSDQIDFLKKQISEQCSLNETYRKEKSTEMESLQEEMKRTKHELSLILLQNKNLKNSNKKILKENQEIQSVKDVSNNISEKKVNSLQNELSEQKKLIEIFKNTAKEAENQSNNLRDKIFLIQKDYDYMCSAIEEFEKKTQEQHSLLMQEIESLKLDISRTGLKA